MKSQNKPWNLAIVGASGLVGKQILSILDERNVSIGNLYLFASEQSCGEEVSFRDKSYLIEVLKPEAFERDIDVAIFSAGKEMSLEFAPIATSHGIVVIDNSSAFRMEKDVPLVVPEVNSADLVLCKKRKIIANPNCSTVQLVMALKPLEKYGLKRIVVSTYQSVSGAGREAMEELSTQVVSILRSEDIEKEVFPHQIAFNCLPHIDIFNDDFYSFEEVKLINETKKILHEYKLPITCTAVRVPTFSSHCESVNVEFEKEFKLENIRQELAQFKGVTVLDNPSNNVYPLNIQATGKDDVFVGRIRRDFSVKSGLNMWVVSDNLRKGAALNAVQILETLRTII